MDSARGYRLKVGTVTELSALVDDFRTSSLRILSRNYGSLVAAAATGIIDSVSVGVREMPVDPIAEACEKIRSEVNANPSVYRSPSLNCVIRFSMVHDAVLASFVHGSEEYQKTWEAMRPVIQWPWHQKMLKPANVSEKSWDVRRKYWEAALSRSGFGSGMEFVLVENELPSLSWGNIRRYLPSMDVRIAMAVEAIRKSDSSGLSDRFKFRNIKEKVVFDLSPELTKANFTRHEGTSNQQRLREATRKPVQKAAASAPVKDEPNKVKASATIDHADIIVSSDLRVFIATPYVKLEENARLFVQVGDSHISFSQNGIQYGYVDNVKRTALDVLKACKSVTVVEVERIKGERLLRAKHIAIVSDVSLSEGLNLSLNRFRKTKITIGEKEIAEWDRN